MTTSPMSRIRLANGQVLNRRTAAMHAELERRLHVPLLPVIQGSYNPGGVGASGGTHDGGGAIDAPAGVKGATVADIVLEARRVGFAAWFRPRLVRNGVLVWGEHVHMIAIGDPELSPAAKAQVRDYLAGRNGLADHGKDDGPRVAPWHRWPLMRRIAAVRLAEKSVKAAQRDLDQWRRTHAA